jgi:hypothetical protein
MDKEERKGWIKNRKAKFNGYPFFKPRINTKFVEEAEESFIQGFYFASTLCINVAMNHLLFEIDKPKLNEKKQAPSTVMMVRSIKEKKIISKQLTFDLVDFQTIVRNNIEHKKSFASISKGLFQYLDKKDSKLYDEFEIGDEIYNKIYPYIAFRALDNYYELSSSWLDFIIKKNEQYYGDIHMKN